MPDILKGKILFLWDVGHIRPNQKEETPLTSWSQAGNKNGNQYLLNNIAHYLNSIKQQIDWEHHHLLSWTFCSYRESDCKNPVHKVSIQNYLLSLNHSAATEWHFPSVSAGPQWFSKPEPSLIYQSIPATQVRRASLAQLTHTEQTDQTLTAKSSTRMWKW